MRTLLLSLVMLTCFTGYASAQDVGSRSKTVCAALETALKKKPADITATDLANLKELTLPHIHIPCFNENDFAGMTNLKKLHFRSLFHKKGAGTETAAISAKVFAKLSSLEELIITDDQLGRLPDDVFSGLKSLKVLDLSDVSLLRVPKSMLELPKIEVIYYDGDGLSKEDYAALQKALGDKLKSHRE